MLNLIKKKNKIKKIKIKVFAINIVVGYMLNFSHCFYILSFFFEYLIIPL